MNKSMANTIPPTLAAHGRLNKVLMHFYFGEPEKTFEDIVADYRKDPSAFESTFLRQPGAGRKTLSILLDFLDSSSNPYDGRQVYVTREQAAKGRKAIDEACHYISNSSPLYETLRTVEMWLTAGTLHIEQDNDPREVFNRSAE